MAKDDPAAPEFIPGRCLCGSARHEPLWSKFRSDHRSASKEPTRAISCAESIYACTDDASTDVSLFGMLACRGHQQTTCHQHNFRHVPVGSSC
jgi:hypothetical protein